MLLRGEQQLASGRMLQLGIRELQSSGRVVQQKRCDCQVVQQRKSDYVELLNMLLTEWKGILHFHELHVALRQPLACDTIVWPELFTLRVLTLNNIDWRLDTLLPHLSLESLTLTLNNYSESVTLGDEGYVAIGNHITATTF